MQFQYACSLQKNNSNIAEFARYTTYLAITKHIDLDLEYFNEDSSQLKNLIKRSLKSLRFSQLVSEATHIRGTHLYHVLHKESPKQVFMLWSESGVCY